MKSVRIRYILLIILAVFSVGVPAQTVWGPQDTATIKEFEQRAKDYVKLRERIEGTMPDLPKKATPEQIEAHKRALLAKVQAARKGATRGQIFTPAVAAIFRRIIKAEFKGRDRRELREAVYEAETKGVPVKVNFGYPESKELLEMPPTLLLALPQLPKQLRFRFVGTNMLLVDRENQMIIDYMTNALP